MKQKVMLTIIGSQTIDGELSSTELKTTGDMTEKNGKYYLTYAESEATGYEGCTTVVKIDGSKKLTLQRFGPTPSILVIEKGQRHQCILGTQVGDISVGIYTSKLRSSLSPNGGSICADYTLDINTSFSSDNSVDIKVKLI